MESKLFGLIFHEFLDLVQFSNGTYNALLYFDGDAWTSSLWNISIDKYGFILFVEQIQKYTINKYTREPNYTDYYTYQDSYTYIDNEYLKYSCGKITNSLALTFMFARIFKYDDIQNQNNEPADSIINYG
jgi:hypothetical protein